MVIQVQLQKVNSVTMEFISQLLEQVDRESFGIQWIIIIHPFVNL